MLADIFLVLFLPAGLLPPPHLLPVFVFHCPIIFASPYSKVLPQLAYGNIGFPRLFLFLSFSLNSLHSISCSLMYFHVRLSLIHSSQRYTAPALYYALVGHRHNAILLVWAQRLSLKILFRLYLRLAMVYRSNISRNHFLYVAQAHSNSPSWLSILQIPILEFFPIYTRYIL